MYGHLWKYETVFGGSEHHPLVRPPQKRFCIRTFPYDICESTVQRRRGHHFSLQAHISNRLNEPSRSSLDTLIHRSIQQEHFYGAIVLQLMPRNIILKEGRSREQDFLFGAYRYVRG